MNIENDFEKSWLSWDDSTFAEARLHNNNDNNDIFIIEYQLHGCPDVLTFTGTSSVCDYVADEVAELCSQFSIKKVQ